MPSFPQRPIVALSLLAAYGSVTWARRTAALSVGSSLGRFAWVFVAAYVLQSIAFAVWSIFLLPLFFSPLRHLPQPTEGNHIILGQYPRIIREATGTSALEWINSIPNDGLIRYRGPFNQERLLVTKPKALAEVLTSKNYEFTKPQVIRDVLSRLLGVGVLLAEGDEHRVQRRHLGPAFAFRHIKDLYPVFWRKGRESVVAMRRAMAERRAAGDTPEDSTRLEIGHWASRTTLDIIGLAGLGRDFGALRDPDNELVATYRAMLNPDRTARFLALLTLVFPTQLIESLPFKRNSDVVAASRFLRQTCADLITQKKAKLRASKREAGDGGDCGNGGDGGDDAADIAAAAAASPDVDILSVALESGVFSDDNLADQMMTFLAAGHETTSSALTWAIYLLCVHADVQTRLRAEIRAHLPPLGDDTEDDGERATDVSSVDIDHLPYLNAVCSEVLRYFPSVPNTLREAVADSTIQGQFVPRGTRIMLVPWAVNRSLELWGDDALEFRPERWLRNEAAAVGSDGTGATVGLPPHVSTYAFMTFLHGPRSCIGMSFARAEFACLLAAWIGRFEFRLQNPADMDESKLEIHGNVSARPKHGMHVFATPLEGW